STIDFAKTAVAGLTGISDQVVTGRRENPTSARANRATLAGKSKSNKTQAMNSAVVSSATVHRSDRGATVQELTSRSKLNAGNNERATPAKKEAEKTPNLQSVGAGKTDPTPKAKVIQWP